jgi:AcrR family transcriptional regulator
VSEPQENRKTLRSEKTRACLLQAARQVLREKGYAHVTVADIAKLAGRAHGTFYLHFANKEAIYEELLEEMWESLKAQGRAIWHADEPMRSVSATVRRFVDAYQENLDLWELAEDMSATNPAFRELRTSHHRLLARKVRSGIQGSLASSHIAGLDLDIVSDILASMLEAACRANFRQGLERSPEVLAGHISTVWGRTLGYIAIEDGGRDAQPSSEN